MDIGTKHQFLALIEQFSYPGIFAFFILGGIGLPVPEDAILVLCGFLISKNYLELVPAAIVAYIGVIASDFIIFSFGRKYGRLIITHKKFQKILSSERLFSLERKFKKFGTLLILFGRHIWGVRAKIFLTAGVMGMPPHKFLAADAVAALITVPVMFAIGYAGEHQLQHFRKAFFHPGHIAIVVAILIILFFLVLHFRRRSQRRSEQNRMICAETEC